MRLFPRQDRRAIGLLSLSQTLSWAGMYYLFASLLLAWEGDLGWSKTEITLALTLAVLASGLTAPLAGRVIENGHGAALLGGGTFLGGLLVGALPMVGTLWQFYALWILIGICHAAALYEPCFSLISRARGAAAKQGITTITLIAGFASSLAFAGSAWLVAEGGWRLAAWVFSAMICLLAAPAAYLGARSFATDAPLLPSSAEPQITAGARIPVAVALGLAFPMMALHHGVILNHLLPLLDERGSDPATAILAASLIGPMQVAGRITMMLAGERASSLSLTLVSFAGVGAAAFLLMASHAMPALVFLAVMLQGAAYGLTSILKPVLTVELLGNRGIARLLGWMALPYLTAAAVAPFLGSVIWAYAGYDMVLAAAVFIAATGFAGILTAARLAR